MNNINKTNVWQEFKDSLKYLKETPMYVFFEKEQVYPETRCLAAEALLMETMSRPADIIYGEYDTERYVCFRAVILEHHCSCIVSGTQKQVNKIKAKEDLICEKLFFTFAKEIAEGEKREEVGTIPKLFYNESKSTILLLRPKERMSVWNIAAWKEEMREKLKGARGIDWFYYDSGYYIGFSNQESNRLRERLRGWYQQIACDPEGQLVVAAAVLPLSIYRNAENTMSNNWSALLRDADLVASTCDGGYISYKQEITRVEKEVQESEEDLFSDLFDCMSELRANV